MKSKTSDVGEDSAWEEYHKQPRYDISLQTEKDPFCYKDIHSCNTLKEAKEVADKEAIETGRAVMVFDRREFLVIYRTGVKDETVR